MTTQASHEDVVVETFTPDHLDDILYIERACFPNHPYPPEVFLDIWAKDHNVFLMASKSDEAIGYLASMVEGLDGHLLSIAVIETHRRRGIGTLLLRESIRRFRRRGIRVLTLEVRTDNQAALGFYTFHGFRCIARKNRYYQDGQPALVMQREL